MNNVKMTDLQKLTVTDLLYDALVLGSPGSWADYEGTFSLFLQIAPDSRLEAYQFDTIREEEMHAVAKEIERRLSESLSPLSWEERAKADSGKPIATYHDVTHNPNGRDYS